jgi:hypothetical protein
VSAVSVSKPVLSTAATAITLSFTAFPASTIMESDTAVLFTSSLKSTKGASAITNMKAKNIKKVNVFFLTGAKVRIK